MFVQHFIFFLGSLIVSGRLWLSVDHPAQRNQQTDLGGAGACKLNGQGMCDVLYCGAM